MTLSATLASLLSSITGITSAVTALKAALIDLDTFLNSNI